MEDEKYKIFKNMILKEQQHLYLYFNSINEGKKPLIFEGSIFVIVSIFY